MVASGELPADCEPGTAGYTAAASNPTGDGGFIKGDTPECMPNVSREQVAAILTGKVKTWDTFKVGGTSLTTAVTAAGGTAPTSSTTKVCRRVEGSGTKLSMDILFLNYPCTLAGEEQTNEPGGFGGPTVIENSGSGDVTDCVVAAHDAGEWAFGYQSNEKIDPKARYLRVDGVEPSNHKIWSGDYLHWVQSTCNIWTGTSGDEETIAEKICTNIGEPTKAGKVIQPYGRGGFIGTAPGFCPTGAAFVPTDPRTAYSHGAGTPNNCKTATINPSCASGSEI
jgi:hypothetical protein